MGKSAVTLALLACQVPLLIFIGHVVDATNENPHGFVGVAWIALTVVALLQAVGLGLWLLGRPWPLVAIDAFFLVWAIWSVGSTRRADGSALRLPSEFLLASLVCFTGAVAATWLNRVLQAPPRA